MKVDIEQVDRQIRNGELDEKTLLLILKNILTIQGQATALINPAAKAAAKNVHEYVDCLIGLLPEEEELVIRTLYVEKRKWTNAEVSLHMSRNTLGRYRRKAIGMMLGIANGTLGEPA